MENHKSSPRIGLILSSRTFFCVMTKAFFLKFILGMRLAEQPLQLCNSCLILVHLAICR